MRVCVSGQCIRVFFVKESIDLSNRQKGVLLVPYFWTNVNHVFPLVELIHVELEEAKQDVCWSPIQSLEIR